MGLEGGHMAFAADDLRRLSGQILDHFAAHGGVAELLQGLSVDFHVHRIVAGVIMVVVVGGTQQTGGKVECIWPLIL